MKATEVLRAALQMSQAGVLQLVEDMRDAPLTAPTPKGGNHPLWVIGHLTYWEGQLHAILLGEANPVAEWEGPFGMGSRPVADAGRYPPLDTIIARFKELRGRTLAILASLSDVDLDRPPRDPPPGFEKIFGTCGQCLLTAALHGMHHRGQVADARAAAGRPPLFA